MLCDCSSRKLLQPVQCEALQQSFAFVETQAVPLKQEKCLAMGLVLSPMPSGFQHLCIDAER